MADPVEQIMFMCRRPKATMPKKSPWGPRWIQDKASFWCKSCQTDFSTLLRRHHCRHCGNVFCGHCSRYKRVITKYGYYKPVRLCNKCNGICAKADQLLDAVRFNDLEGAKALTGEGIDVSFTTEVLPPLAVACLAGSADMVRMLISAGADVNEAAGTDSTVAAEEEQVGLHPLHAAVSQGGHLEVVNILLEADAKVDSETQKGFTALHLACTAGHIECIRALIGKGAAIGVLDKQGETPLHKAVREGKKEAVQLLMDAGADPTAKGPGAATPRELADKAKRMDIAQMLSG